MQSTLTKHQVKKYGPKFYTEHGRKCAIVAEARYDDQCGNGHNSFALTADIYSQDRHPGETTIQTPEGKTLWMCGGGCCHEEIAKHFPELAPLIKWHLCDSEGPMHYLANTIFLAGNKDYNGRAQGEPSDHAHGIRFDNVPITHDLGEKFWSFIQERKGTGDFQIVEVAHPKDPKTYGSKFTFPGYSDTTWHGCPFDNKTEAEEFAQALNKCKAEFVIVPTDWSTGKARELDAARRAAIWPDATDEDLTAPGLKERLEARLPKLMEEFRTAVESLGFTF